MNTDYRFKTIVKMLKAVAPNQGYTVLEMAQLIEVDKRRIYDLFSVLCGLGLAHKEGERKVVWSGKNFMLQTINLKLQELELKSYKEPLEELFYLDDHLSVGTIALTYIAMFCFFGRLELSIDEIYDRLLSVDARVIGFKRRLYLASSVMEQLNILKRTKEKGRFQFLMDPYELHRDALISMQIKKMIPPSTILANLNRFSKNELKTIYEDRQCVLKVRNKKYR